MMGYSTFLLDFWWKCMVARVHDFEGMEYIVSVTQGT